MKKNEPLDLTNHAPQILREFFKKRKGESTYTATDLYEVLEMSEMKLKEKIKSAILELLKEIEAKEKEIDASLSAILNKTKKDTAVNRGALYGWGEALFWVKGKIKKWFADVCEND
ncbi:MAG: hypothetical protein DRJ34_01530 [Thermoprotei archaeon]|nr:MAG: hypothetical protein DRJ34_01530 [Thermoprotei archaeon]